MTFDSLSSSYLNECRQALNEEQTLSLANSNQWEHVDRARVHQDWGALYKPMITLVATADPAGPEVQSHPDMVTFLADAMLVYARTTLS